MKFGRPEISKAVQNLPDKRNKTSFRSPALASARIANKNMSGPAASNVLDDFPKFHPNRFTSSGVIAERVNIVKMHHKVNPILVEAIASLRVNIIALLVRRVSMYSVM